MIYFTHSYHRQKLGKDLLDNDLVDGGIYINKIGTIAKNPITTIGNYKVPVIYESPLYISSYIDMSEPKIAEEIRKRNLTNELINNSKILDYISSPELFVVDVKGCWENYLDNIPNDSVELVLTMPAIDELALDMWSELSANIPKAHYKWISIAFYHSELADIKVNDIVKKMGILCDKLNTNNILFTILTTQENVIYNLTDIKKINELLSELQKTKHVVVHHADTLCFQSTQVKNASIGLHNQTKNLSITQAPFITIEGHMQQKATSFISSDLLSDIHKKRFISGHKMLKKIGDKKSLSITTPIYKKMEQYFKSDEKDEWASMKMSASEFKIILEMTNTERNNTKKIVDELFTGTKIKKKEIIYKIDGSKLKIL